MATFLIGKHNRIALLGAGTRGQFRREDQMGCAWVAEKLVKAGYISETPETDEYIKKWTGVDPNVIREGRSADYLRATGQERDLEFILEHIDDLNVVPRLIDGELVPASPASVETTSSVIK